MIVIRPCRFEECPAVLALWERAGAIPSPTDTLEELRRLVQTRACPLDPRPGTLRSSLTPLWASTEMDRWTAMP